MSNHKKDRIWYSLFNPDYERVSVEPGLVVFRNCETARTKRQALRKARRMGSGTEIEQRLPGGKLGKVWIFQL
jgi:murein endopeptidase